MTMMILRRHLPKSARFFPLTSSKYFCAPYATKHVVTQNDRREKELRRLFRQRKVDKNIEIATKSLKPANYKVEFTEQPYPTSVSPGEKKDANVPLPLHYSPEFIESHWYEWWEKNGFFEPRKNDVDPNAKTFSMVLPPPNVTGKLHLGHALTCAVEDSLARWQTMRGNEVLWVPGTDHAGIATQVVVERHLEQERGETRFDLGPDKMKEAIWKWKEDKGENINHQLRKLGSSLDWSRSIFTLDSSYAYAVTEAFVRLFKEGLIYRDKCCVNWCCHLQSTVSDLEVETMMLDRPTVISVPGYQNPLQFGAMHEFAFKLCQPVGDVTEIVVGTTRLETVPGDEAVAVHPDDPRYAALIGKRVYHPIIYGKTIPVIADKAVDMDLGTGAMKVTPAHDFTDFEIGKRHGLPVTSVITADGKVRYQRPNAPDHLLGSYQHINNQPRFKAKECILTHLINLSLYRGARSQNSVLRLCSRSGDVIEPMIKEQWFIRTDEMAQELLEVFDKGELKFVHQSMYEKMWRDWLNRATPWCISRQIWWGHRIPAYKCRDQSNQKSFWVAAHNRSDALKEAQIKRPDVDESCLEIEQDNDVLDTWFSSALHPFASLGWPKQTQDLKRYYPLTLMETGSDLIYFWVARMAMLGLKLTGQVPFREVLFHPMVRDKYNRKMSKSVGNVVDPMHVISGVGVENRVEDLKEFDLHRKDAILAVETIKSGMGGDIPVCGSDALRMSLLQHNLESQGIQFDVIEAVTARKFCNKVFNSFKFLLQYISEDPKFIEKIHEARASNKQRNIMETWMHSFVVATAETCDRAFSNYKFNEALKSVKKLWFDMSTIYLRYCFIYLRGDEEDKQSEVVASRVTDELLEKQSNIMIITSMIDVIETSLRLLSPFAPFLTEELWQRIPACLLSCEKAESISQSTYPTIENIKWERNTAAERAVEKMWSTVEAIRHDKEIYSLPRYMDIVIVGKSKQICDDFKLMAGFIHVFLSCNSFEVQPYSELEKLKEECIGSVNDDDDVIVLYRFTPSEFQKYLLDKDVEAKLKLRRQTWIKRVERLEQKVEKSKTTEHYKKAIREILNESEKYLKVQRFSESIEAFRSRIS